jgi:ubiquinol-cytochrome c reductase iron-sulfur subunit
LAETTTHPITAPESAKHIEPREAGNEVGRRDFLLIATGAFAAVGAAAAAWPFIHQMNPDASALALASIDVDLSSIQEGQSITVMWRGKPVFIRYRSPAE